MRPKPPPNASATTNSMTVPAANDTVAAGIGPMSRPRAELIGACMANPAPTASVRAMADPRSIAPTLQGLQRQQADQRVGARDPRLRQPGEVRRRLRGPHPGAALGRRRRRAVEPVDVQTAGDVVREQVERAVGRDLGRLGRPGVHVLDPVVADLLHALADDLLAGERDARQPARSTTWTPPL